MSNLWDYINSINYTKKDLMTGTENDELAEAGYVPFVVNRTLSYFPDTILYANEMNVNHHIDKKLQYYYLINTIRPRKRYSKWAKKQNSSDLEAVKLYYKMNDIKASQALALLTEPQLAAIKKALTAGEQ